MKLEIKSSIYDRGEGNYEDFFVLFDGKIIHKSESEKEAILKLKEIVDAIADSVNH